MALHLDLEHVVVHNAVGLEHWHGRRFDDDSRGHVLRNQVVDDQGFRLFFSQDSRSIVVYNLVVFNFALRPDQDKAVIVVVYCVFLDQQSFLSFDHENALRLRVLNHVPLNLGHARRVSAQSNVSLDVRIQLVGIDSRVGPCRQKDTLVVVVSDNVRVWERLQSESVVNVILQVLLSQLVSEKFVVKLR